MSVTRKNGAAAVTGTDVPTLSQVQGLIAGTLSVAYKFPGSIAPGGWLAPAAADYEHVLGANQIVCPAAFTHATGYIYLPTAAALTADIIVQLTLDNGGAATLATLHNGDAGVIALTPASVPFIQGVNRFGAFLNVGAVTGTVVGTLLLQMS